MASIIKSPGPASGHAASTKSTRPGVAGNAGRNTIPLRQWAAPSYDATTGRSVSSVDAQGSREHVTNNNHASGNAQFPAGEPGKGSPTLAQLDANRTTISTPVRNRRIG